MKLNVDQRKTELRGLGFDKASLVLVHDASHNARSYYGFMKRYSRLGFDCYAIDLSGHGRSNGNDQLNEFSLSDYEDDVVNVLKQFQNPPILIGHGMGGLVSQMIYQNNSDLISGMVLIASFSKLSWLDVTKMMMHHYKSTQNMLKTLMTTNQMDTFIHSNFVDNHFDRLDSKVYFGLPQLESKTALKNMIQFRTNPKIQIKKPVMVIGSNQDLIVNVKQTKALAKIYHTKPYIMDGLCHDMILDPKRKEMENEINRWINRNFVNKKGD